MRRAAVRPADFRAVAPYISRVGIADGSIMPVIMTAHIAQSSSTCVRSHLGVIIQALAPVIGPYMSRAITTIHAHDASGSNTSSSANGRRLDRIAPSSSVGGRDCESTVSVTAYRYSKERRDSTRATAVGVEYPQHHVL